CILYSSLPEWGRLVFEYFIELTLIVIVGIFLASLLEKYFLKYKTWYPKNPVTSFIYASLLPVCACAVIPLVRTMKDRINMRTLVSFILAAPLLSPYIIMLSFSVLGAKYGILRILCSFVLAIGTGYIVGFFYDRRDNIETKGLGEIAGCKKGSCPVPKKDVFMDTYRIFIDIVPYIILAGFIGVLFEFMVQENDLLNLSLANTPLGTLIVILAGIPFFFCNGSEVLLLRPFIDEGGFLLGTAMAFSLTSTSICITSFVMLLKFLGKKLTLIMTASIIVLVMILSMLINALV
ncbi:MAG: permease, partial [Candidatus Woesearchaeota archaeon]